ncbi:MAG: hypothetical protein AAFQ42_03375, partial [Pseudomonadota bacterium]
MPSAIHDGLPPHAPGQRIGLLGGSFNPPHGGHRHISCEALKRLRLHAVWWIVTPGNPLKQNDDLPRVEDRAIAAAACACHPRIAITLFERKIGARFTADTLAEVQRRTRGTRFTWLMGGDNLAMFHRWDRWRTIANTTPLAAGMILTARPCTWPMFPNARPACK